MPLITRFMVSFVNSVMECIGREGNGGAVDLDLDICLFVASGLAWRACG